MREFIDSLPMINEFFAMFEGLSFFGYLRLFVDIYIVWIIVYLLLNLIKLNIRTFQLLKGVAFILILRFISEVFHLVAVDSITSVIINFGVIGLFILFQPELRGALEQIGLSSAKSRDGNDYSSTVETLVKSVEYLSKRRIGALILIEQDVKIEQFVTAATMMNSDLSFELLNTIFVPTTPLHDGAVIIRKDKIYCAGAYLPLTERTDISKELGTRHRAAIGASEITDGIILVVSEETGSISIAKNGRINRFAQISEFSEALQSYLK